jgi:hypothetical protein
MLADRLSSVAVGRGQREDHSAAFISSAAAAAVAAGRYLVPVDYWSVTLTDDSGTTAAFSALRRIRGSRFYLPGLVSSTSLQQSANGATSFRFHIT